MALKLPDESTRQFLLKNLTRGEHGYRWKMNLPVLSAQYANVTAGVDPDGIYTGPVLFIKGERSRYIDEAKWPEIQQQFPNAILKIIPGAGHWVHAQAPQIFAEMVEDFIAGG
jgi:esterase